MSTDNGWAWLLGSEPGLPYRMPKHRQIAAQLRVGILSNQLEAGTALPSLSELAEIYGVSRPTASNAMHALAKAGWVVIEPGSCAYVADGERGPLAYEPKVQPPTQEEITEKNMAALLEVFGDIERHLHRIADALDPERQYER